MPRLLHRLANGNAGDPALVLDLGQKLGATLLDCGDLARVRTPCLHRVTDLFVSHAHIDHLFGFDWLLRTTLGHARDIRVFGPSGIARHVAGHLAGYCWNIPLDVPVGFLVGEVRGPLLRRTLFRVGVPGVLRRSLGTARHGGLLLATRSHEVRFAALDHGVSSLAFRFQAKAGVDLDERALARRLGVPPGRWLGAAREAILAGWPDRRRIDAGPRKVAIREIRPFAALRWGTVIAYVADAAPTAANFARAVDLVRGASVLYAAAHFTERDLPRARASRHLTAAWVARLAREAAVGDLVLFHPSRKYHGRLDPLLREARAIFPGVHR